MKKRSEFLRVAREGRKIVLPGFVAQFLPDSSTASMRVGFTVTKRVGNSVVRNRTRRRLREALRLTVREAEVPAGDLVLIGRSATGRRDFAALLGDVRHLLKKLHDL